MPFPSVSIIDWLGDLARALVLWGGVLLLLASALSFYWGWNRRKLSLVITKTPRSDIAEVRSSGTVRIRGEIAPQAQQDTFVSPIKGNENCILSVWEIKEMFDTPRSESWERSAWGVQAVPFYLSDGTEQILVDVDDEVVGNKTNAVFTPESLLGSDGVSIEGLRCEFEEFDVHIETGYDESPPHRVTEFLENTDGLSVDPMVTALGDVTVDASKRKYLEQTLQPGDTVSIIGHAVRRREGMESTAHPDDLVLTQAADATLRLSERPFDELADGGGALLYSALTGVVGVILLGVRVVL